MLMRTDSFRELDRPRRYQESANLADILERVLDKGILIAGDIRVNLLDSELLTIKIRLLIASVDKAREIGIDRWEHDPALSSGQRDPADENPRLREWIEAPEAGRRAIPSTRTEHDPALSSGQRDLADEIRRLRERTGALRERIGALEAARRAGPPTRSKQAAPSTRTTPAPRAGKGRTERKDRSDG